MIKFTIATCTYNAEKELPPTLQSLQEQEYPEVEHLIIDGASKDGSLALLKAYEAQNEQAGSPHSVRIISEKDGGLYDAMNKALRNASGDYILFLNAGDRFHNPQVLSLLAKAAETAPHTPGLIYGDTHIVDSEGKFLRSRRLAPPEQLSWKDFRHGMLVCHQAFVASTFLASNCPYDLKYRYSADYDWCIRIMQEAERHKMPLVNSHTVVADYLAEGMTTRNHRKSLWERFHIMCHHFGWCTTVLFHIYFVFRIFLKK